MGQYWTIVDTVTDEVLYAAFLTPAAGAHPRHNGWDWDAATQRAVRIDAPPDADAARFDGAAWVAELPVLRRRRWEQAKFVRDARMQAGCATPLGRVDTDDDSQRKINGAVSGAMIAALSGQPFTIDWTMSDNAIVTHDGPAMMAMGIAVLTYLAQCQAAGTAARAAIDAAGDAAAIAAVDIEAEYP